MTFRELIDPIIKDEGLTDNAKLELSALDQNMIKVLEFKISSSEVSHIGYSDSRSITIKMKNSVDGKECIEEIKSFSKLIGSYYNNVIILHIEEEGNKLLKSFLVSSLGYQVPIMGGENIDMSTYNKEPLNLSDEFGVFKNDDNLRTSLIPLSKLYWAVELIANEFKSINGK